SFFFFQAEDGIRDFHVTGVQTCALPISSFGGGPMGRLWPATRGRISPACGWTDAPARPDVHERPVLSTTMAPLSTRRAAPRGARSEERRVGKECGAGRARAR